MLFKHLQLTPCDWGLVSASCAGWYPPSGQSQWIPLPPVHTLRPGLIRAAAAPPSLSARVSCVLFSLQQDLLGDRSSLQCVPSSTEHVNDTPNPHPHHPTPQTHTHIDPLVYEWRCSDAHLQNTNPLKWWLTRRFSLDLQLPSLRINVWAPRRGLRLDRQPGGRLTSQVKGLCLRVKIQDLVGGRW